MKILMVNFRSVVSGGPERYMFGVTTLLEQAGHEVVPFSIRYTRNVPSEWSPYFVSPLAGEDAVYFREHVQTPRTVMKSLERAFYSREVYRAVRRLVRETRPDVALVLHYLRKLSPSVLLALRDAGVPIVVRLSDFGMVCPQLSMVREGRTCSDCVGTSMLPSIRHRCVQRSAAASMVNAGAMGLARRLRWFDAIDAFIAPSQVMRHMMVAGGYGPERIVHLPTFVALRPPEPAPARRRQIAFVGRLEPIKGVHVLVDAFAGLQQDRRHQDVELVIVGDDSSPYAQWLKDRVRRLGLKHVDFRGASDGADVAATLSRSLLSAVPSLWPENLPNTLLESLACGTPVVGSDVAGVAEVIGRSSAGTLFPMGDSNGLRRALALLLGDRERLRLMSTEAHRLAATTYSPSRHLEGLLDVLGSARQRHPD